MRRVFCVGCCSSVLAVVLWLSPHDVQAQQTTLTLEGFGQTYYPAGLMNLETRVRSYPWVTGEAQVWVGESPSAESEAGPIGDVVVLAVDVREPTGHAHLRAGRFVLSTGAVRPVHVDGGYVRLRADRGFAAEAFGGSPVLPRFQQRSFDWLAGGRVSQRIGELGVAGASYVHRRDYGEVSDEEVGLDLTLMPLSSLDLAGRASYDLTSRGVSEVSVTASTGSVEKRLDVYAQYRNASLILPATSLFSVLSDASTTAAGVAGRWQLFPRLRLFGDVSYRHVAEGNGGAGSLGSRLWLDPDGVSFLEGELSHQQVPGAQWTGLRGLMATNLADIWRVGGEVEVVVPERGNDDAGSVWPWARLWARVQVRPSWLLAAAVEGSASPQFTRMFSAMLRVSFTGRESS